MINKKLVYGCVTILFLIIEYQKEKANHFYNGVLFTSLYDSYILLFLYGVTYFWLEVITNKNKD